MEDADKNMKAIKKHFVDHLTNEGGVHGVAILNTFSLILEYIKPLENLGKEITIVV